MSFLRKLKECGIATCVVMAIVFAFVLFGVIPFEWNVISKFLIGAAILIVGQALFLVGVDNSIVKMGQVVGKGFIKLRKLWLILLFAFCFGFLTTVAEPDVNILVGQINSIGSSILTFLLLFVFGLGVGSFVVLGMFKILKKIDLKWFLLVGYAIIFILMIFTPNEYIAVAFDGGGVTTGPITSPFLLTMTIALAATVGSKKDSSFGMIAIASIGAVIFLLVFFLIYGDLATVSSVHEYSSIWALGIDVLKSVALVFLPLVALFLIFNFTVGKISKSELGKILIGVLIAFVGLVLFLIGVNFGFLTMSNFIGHILGLNMAAGGSFVAPICFALIVGIVIIYTEPSVLIFAEQVASATSNVIRKQMVIAFIAIGVGIAFCLAIIILTFNLPLWAFLLGFYSLTIILAFIVPPQYAGVAFDSGGVASGTMAAAFVLPLTIGYGGSIGSSAIGFGVIGLVAVVPILTLEILFLIVSHKQNVNNTTFTKVNNRLARMIKMASSKTKNFFKIMNTKSKEKRKINKEKKILAKVSKEKEKNIKTNKKKEERLQKLATKTTKKHAVKKTAVKNKTNIKKTKEPLQTKDNTNIIPKIKEDEL